MVGFQEVPHLELSKPISDNCFKIGNIENILKLEKILNSLDRKVQVLEILDDVQRINLKVKKFKKTNNKEKKLK